MGQDLGPEREGEANADEVLTTFWETLARVYERSSSQSVGDGYRGIRKNLALSF